MIHVWSLLSILSFSPDTSRSPVHTLSTHRGAITSLVCGHSTSTANTAVSISEDKSAIVWDYHNGQALRTYLLPEAPTAVALDPADRAFYVAYEDGSLQVVDFYDEVQQSAPTDTLREVSLSHRPVQTSTKRRFNAESQKLGGALSLSLSWDGTTLVSGHASGKIAAWDIAKGTYISTLSSLVGPVTNVQFLPPTGFPNALEPKFKIHTVVKPKQDTGTSNAGNGLVPPNYSLNMQLTGRISVPTISATERRKTEKSEFEEALTHPVFPMSMLEESLAELESWNTQSNGTVAASADFLSLSADNDLTTSKGGVAQDAGEMNELKKQLASLQRIQKVTFSQLAELREEKEWFVRKEKKLAVREHVKAQQKLSVVNGDQDGDVEMSEDGSSASESESNDGATTDDSNEVEEESEAESSE
jgi:pre-rRNA-processing protein IPI3